jgi:hypothetical protein
MKVYKVELMIIDFDNLGAEGIKEELGNTRFSNDCLNPKIMRIDERDAGEWTDEHPLNKLDKFADEYNRLFSE